MVISCVVVGCANRFKKDSGVKFHRIPGPEMLTDDRVAIAIGDQPQRLDPPETMQDVFVDFILNTLLEHGDLVLANHGFLISDELAACGAQLAIPAFTRGKSQLSPKEIQTGRRLSRARIHVERAIERIKNFKILSSTMKNNMVPHTDNIVTICSAISNFHPKLVD